MVGDREARWPQQRWEGMADGARQEPRAIPQDCAKHWRHLQHAQPEGLDEVLRALAAEFDPYLHNVRGTKMGQDYWGKAFFNVARSSDQ